jgi:hypothetical protein
LFQNCFNLPLPLIHSRILTLVLFGTAGGNAVLTALLLVNCNFYIYTLDAKNHSSSMNNDYTLLYD